MNFIFENKKKFILNNISNMCSLAYYFFPFILFNQFIIVWLNKKIILINKFSKHNRVNVTSCKIKYLDLHMFLNFFLFFKIQKRVEKVYINCFCWEKNI